MATATKNQKNQRTQKNQKKYDSTLEVTNVRIYPVNSKKATTLVANVQVCFNGSLVVNGFKLVEGKNGVFVSFPSVEYNGEYHDTCYMLNTDDRDALVNGILDAWDSYDSE